MSAEKCDPVRSFSVTLVEDDQAQSADRDEAVTQGIAEDGEGADDDLGFLEHQLPGPLLPGVDVVRAHQDPDDGGREAGNEIGVMLAAECHPGCEEPDDLHRAREPQSAQGTKCRVLYYFIDPALLELGVDP